jgi:hypothetical protein
MMFLAHFSSLCCYQLSFVYKNSHWKDYARKLSNNISNGKIQCCEVFFSLENFVDVQKIKHEKNFSISF